MIGIYKITNNINGKFYIGKSNNIKRRFGEHRAPNHETNFNLKRAFKKYNLSTLCGHLKGKYKTCKGLHYKYCSVTTNCDECSSVE